MISRRHVSPDTTEQQITGKWKCSFLVPKFIARIIQRRMSESRNEIKLSRMKSDK